MKRRIISPVNLFYEGGIDWTGSGGTGFNATGQMLDANGQLANNNIVSRSSINTQLDNFKAGLQIDKSQNTGNAAGGVSITKPKNSFNADSLAAGGVEAATSFLSNYLPNSNNEMYKERFANISENAALSAGNQYRYDSNTTTGLLNQINNGGAQTTSVTGTDVDWRAFRPSKAQQWGNVGKSMASGAAIGSSIMPGWGTVIGMGVGAAASALGSLFGRNKAKKEAKRRMQEAANAAALQTHSNAANVASNQYAINNAVANQQAYANNYILANYHAFGGMFDMSPSYYDMFNTQMNVSRANTIDKVKMNDGLNINKYDYGGQAPTMMSYNPDVTEINAGGTHEQNPNQGVQIGVDQRGIPNMVEEGEVIWKRPSNSLIGKNMFAEGGSADAEYVFTNRWNPTQELLREVGIAKKKTGNKKDSVPTDSYADVAKDINKAAKERPNDPIARNTINKNLERLAQAQEKERAMREMQALAQEQEARRNMALGMGSMMGQGMNPSDSMVSERQHNQPNEDQSLSEYNRSGSPMLMAYGGPANIHAINPWLENYLNDNPYGNTSYGQQVMNRVAPIPQFRSPITQDPPFDNNGLIKWTSPDGSTVIYDGGGASQSNSWRKSGKSGKFLPLDGTYFTYREPQYSVTNVLTQTPEDRPHENNITNGDMPRQMPAFEPDLMGTAFLRYAPVAGSLFNVGMDIAGKNSPDYRYVSQLAAEANKGTFVPVASNPVGDYLAYNPFDRNYMTNKLNAQANATSRAIENASGGQRNNYLANLIAANYGSQIALGDAQRKADEQNFAQRQAVTGFNRDTNKFNSEEDLKAQMANQQALASLRQFKLAGLGEAAKLKYQMDMDDLSRRHANFTTLFNNLGEVGRDALNYNMAMSNPALLYYMDKDGKVDYKGLLAQTQKEERERRKKKGSKSTANA